MDKYYISAIITPKSGKEDEVLKAILANIPNVRNEKGCIRYDLHKIRGEGGVKFMFYEIWADKDVFKAHGTMPHMLSYKEKVKDLLACPTQVDVWSGVDIIE